MPSNSSPGLREGNEPPLAGVAASSKSAKKSKKWRWPWADGNLVASITCFQVHSSAEFSVETITPSREHQTHTPAISLCSSGHQRTEAPPAGSRSALARSDARKSPGISLGLFPKVHQHRFSPCVRWPQRGIRTAQVGGDGFSVSLHFVLHPRVPIPNHQGC